MTDISLMQAARDLVQEYKSKTNPYPVVGAGTKSIFVYFDLEPNQKRYETYKGFPVVYTEAAGEVRAYPAR